MPRNWFSYGQQANCLVIILLIFVSTSSFLGQTPDLSPEAIELKKQVENGNSKAIIEFAEKGNVNLIPYLRDIAADKKLLTVKESNAYYAHIALAKLNDSQAIEQIMSEVDAVDYDIQDIGMGKLRLLGGKIALKKFHALLDDMTPRKKDCESKSPASLCGDVGYYPRGIMAMFYLSELVENPPKAKSDRSWAKNQLNMWKEWFAQHPDMIQ